MTLFGSGRATGCRKPGTLGTLTAASHGNGTENDLKKIKFKKTYE